MTFRKLTGLLHLWLGLGSGLVVFVVSLTGCIYVFETELREVFEKSFTTVEARNQPRVPVSELYRIGKMALEAELGYPVRASYQSVSVYRDPTKAPYFYAYAEKPEGYHNVYLNPYTGEVLHIVDRRTDFFGTVLRIHRRLLLPETLGRYVVGVSVLIFVISLISGLILWWPRNRAAARQRFLVKWSAKWRRVNYDSHNVFGFYALPLALVIALTGLVWSFDWMEKTVDWVANGGTASPEVREPKINPGLQSSTALPDRLLAGAWAKYPKVPLFSVDFPATDSAALGLSVYPSLTTYHDSRYLLFDPSTGRLLHEDSRETQTAGQRMRAMNYDIHIGKILGLPGQLLAFFASLVSASLPVTGFLIWWGRRRKACKDLGQGVAMASTVRKPRPVVRRVPEPTRVP
jgi:uncharacterized iron-regulated membrane protein